MADEHLATYLNDHLAGSVAAVELLEHLEAANAGAELGRFAAELRADVEADRQELKEVMARLDVGQGRMRKASAWLSGKVAELKLRLDDREGGDLYLLEAFEALSLGIEGKRLLWLALAAASEEAPALRVADFERLAGRAVEQRSRVEARRLAAARRALSPEPATA